MRLRLHTVAAAGRIDPPRHWRALHEYETHRVPVGATILDAKYCECAGATFFAERNPTIGTAPSVC